MNRYATIDQVKQEIDTEKTVTTAADMFKFLWQAIGFVSERIEVESGLEFAPRIETRYFNARGRHILSSAVMDVVDGQHVPVKSPLLSVTSVNLDGSVTPIDPSNLQAVPRGAEPIRQLSLLAGGSWQTYATNYRDTHAIAGVWGHRTRYSTDGYKLADSISLAIANATIETVNVSSTSASTDYGLPRFSPGMLVRMGGTQTDEMRYIYTINSSTQFSATRADNGSTAGTQAQDTAVYVWEPEPVIVRATIRWTAYLWDRRSEFGAVTYDGLTTKTFPVDMPAEVENILRPYGFCKTKGAEKTERRA